MQIRGEWFICDDGVVRPTIRGEVQCADGAWVQALFLVDTGADRTVLNALVLAALGTPGDAGQQLGGIGGLVDSVVLEGEIRLYTEAGGEVMFRGQYAALTDPAALDMSVLGRDVLDVFAVIVDGPGDTVLLVREPHFYRVDRQ